MLGKTKNIKYLLHLAVILALWGVHPAAEAWVKNMTVYLKVNADQTGMDVTTRGKCAKKNHKGCLDVPARRQARLQFKLKGNRQCDGGSWNLSGVYLGGKNSLEKTGLWGNLDMEVQEDFNVADASTGLLNADSGSSKTKIVIFNENKYAYDIWYKVTATCVSESGSSMGTIETDPRIKNGGTQ